MAISQQSTNPHAGSAQSAAPRQPVLQNAALRPWQIWAGLLLLAVLIVISYWPSLTGAFIWDDELLITKNDLITSPGGLSAIWWPNQKEPVDYWPLTNTSFWLEWQLWGANPTPYHITNLLLHLASSMLIWAILRRLSIPGAFLAALLYAVHPVNLESVAWISQRKNTLSLLFFLLSVLWYLLADSTLSPSARLQRAPGKVVGKGGGLNSPEQSFAPRWYFLSLVAFTLAMLSKGSVAILPPILLLLIWWSRGRIDRWDCLRVAPFFLVTAVLVPINIWFQKHGTGEVFRRVTAAQRLAGAGTVVWFYLAKALLPVDLIFVYPQWQIRAAEIRWWIPVIMAAVVSALLAWHCRRFDTKWARHLLMTWAFFCLALLPVMGFIDVGYMRYSLVADHYQYIAIIAVLALGSAIFVAAVSRIPSPAFQTQHFLGALVVGLLAALTWRQSHIYHDAETLYQATIAKNPNCWLAYNNEGIELFEDGKIEEAIAHYQRALQVDSSFSQAHNNYGLALEELGRHQAAIEEYQQALNIRPNYGKAYNNLGLSQIKAGNPQAALQALQKALELMSDAPEVHFNLAYTLRLLGRQEEEMQQYGKALALKPDYPQAENSLGSSLLELGRAKQALEHFQRAIRLKPDYAEAHSNLANALALQNQMQAAVEQYEIALRLRPKNSVDLCNFGNTLLQLKKFNEAAEKYRQALEIDPNFAEAHSNLGIILAQLGKFPEALQQYQQAIECKPDYSEAYANLAAMQLQLNHQADAIVSAKKALELARAQGKTTLADQLEGWLQAHPTENADPQNNR